MGQPEYEEFDLQLDRAEDAYTARVVDSPTGPTAAVPFQLPGTPESLKLLVLTLRAVRRIRALETEAAPDARKYGAELFNAIFQGDVLSALRGSLHVASSRDHGLRLRLRFTDPAALANVPWELLYDPVRHRFLCQYGKYPVVRFLEIPEPVAPLRVDGPVRMLVVISAPRDYPPLDVEAEWEHLSTLLQPLVAAGRLQLDRLPSATLADIHRALLEHEYHVFHYIGHGGVDPRSGDGVLALTGPDGLSRLESGQDLGVMLSNSPIRLAVLNSCEGARINDVDPYAGTAISLVQQGIPAVVAMQFEISDEAAFAFSSTLYDAITEGRPIDLAVTLARQSILATSRTEWATPVLYLRSSDGAIFDIPHPASVSGLAATPAPAPAPAPAPEEPTPVDLGPPPAPTELAATLVGRHDVDLRWSMPEGGSPAHAWDVLRDGVAVLRSNVPGATDLIPGPGTYTYSVIAIDDRHRRSAESDPRTVFVDQPTAPLPPPRSSRQPVPVPVPTPAHAPAPARRSRWPWVLAALAVLVLAWLVIPNLLPGGNGGDGGNGGGSDGTPVRPVGLRAVPDGQKVVLTWAAPEAGTPPVEEWVVYRDLVEIQRTTERRFTDDPGEGLHAYTVAAVGPGGTSPQSDPAVVTIPAANGGGQPPAETPTVDLRVTAQPLEPGGGSGEVTVPFRVEEAQGAHPAAKLVVTVAVGEGGRILDAAIATDTDSPIRCEGSETSRVCSLPELPAGGGTDVRVTVRFEGTAFLVRATATSETKEAVPGDNRDGVDVTSEIP